MEALDRLQAGRTVIVIAHRLTTVRRADVIFVVEGGRIVERGAHQELMALGGQYRSLYELQFSRAADGDGEAGQRRRDAGRSRDQPSSAAVRPAAPRPIRLFPASGRPGRRLDGELLPAACRTAPAATSRCSRAVRATSATSRARTASSSTTSSSATRRRARSRRWPTCGCYSNRHAEVLWAGRALHRLIDRARSGFPAGRRLARRVLPEVKGLVEIYPVDRKMRGLLGAAAARRCGTRCSPVAQDGVPPSLNRIELVRYKPGRKAVLRYRLRGGRAGRVRAGACRRPGRGASGGRRGWRPRGLPTPAPLSSSPIWGSSSSKKLPARRLPTSRRTSSCGGSRLWPRPSPSSTPPVWRTSRRWRSATRRAPCLAAARTLATVRPEVGALALRLGATIAARLAESPGRSVPVHGDFYDDQVLVSDAGVVLLDFDAAGMGNPLLDVGNFLRPHQSAARSARPGDFLDAYAARDPGGEGRCRSSRPPHCCASGITPFR